MSTAASVYRVVAHNYALDSDNKIHSDDVASRYGFKGGLVPGVADVAYLARAVYDAWGERWLDRGTLEAKLIKPIYDREIACARALPGEVPNRLVLELTNPEGTICATGAAGLDDAQAPPDPADYPRLACVAPDARPEPGVAGFPAGLVLGAYEYVYRAEAAAREAAEMFVDRWPGARPWHPVTCLHDANRILRANVKLGPWIHTASRLQLYSAPAEGDQISLRGRVTDTYEKRGHVMTECDLALFASERPVARVQHTAIIRLASD